MNDWKEVIEEGVIYYINDELGNIAKLGDVYVSIMPVVCRLGPFASLEEAKSALTRKDDIKNLVEEYNSSILGRV